MLKIKSARGTAVLAMLLALAGCAGTEREMEAGYMVPTAEGEVKAEETRNGNVRVAVDVDNLAPASALAEEANVCVVWAEDLNSDRVVNLGPLWVDSRLEGEMEAVTELRHFNVFVTPEADILAPSPSGRRVLAATVVME